MTQNDMVLDYIERHGSIDPWTAMRDLRILRLGARVFDLRAAGHPIVTIIKTATDGYGHTVRWAEYRMKKDPLGATNAEQVNGEEVESPLPSKDNTNL